MLKKTFLVLSLLGCGALTHLAFAQDATPVEGSIEPATRPGIIQVTDKEALTAALNTDVVVEGTVDVAAWSNSGKVLNINFQDASESRFLAVIFVRDRTKFDQAFSGDVSKTLTGAKVRLKGKLIEYGGKSSRDKGRPEIILSDPAQVTLVGLTAEPPASQPAE